MDNPGNIINIDKRLKTISEMIKGGVVADVGSDHAYLPIWLIQNKKIKKAYAIDISVNVINKIKKNLKRYNISENIITPVLSDGLSEKTNEIYNINDITDVIISGLGGATIASILDKMSLDKKNINFVLQSNNKDEVLRGFLYNNGFDIRKEIIVEVDNWIYNIIQTKYTGKIYKPELIEIITGKNIKHAGYINNIIIRLRLILKDLDKKGIEKYSIKTTFGHYTDIENLIKNISEIINL